MGARQQWLVSVLAGCLLTLSRARLSAGTTFRALGWPDLAGGRGRIEATRAESQWIVAARPLCHLQYP
ncbi:hypothetical protein HN51_040307, partial [Arachis hypogaea]